MFKFWNGCAKLENISANLNFKINFSQEIFYARVYRTRGKLKRFIKFVLDIWAYILFNGEHEDHKNFRTDSAGRKTFAERAGGKKWEKVSSLYPREAARETRRVKFFVVNVRTKPGGNKMNHMQTNQETYALIIDTQYYRGDAAHPRGWSIAIATDENNQNIIGDIATCRAALELINNSSYCLGHGECSWNARIARVEDFDLDYSSWLDTFVDWDGCPSPDGTDDDANCEWAEIRAYENQGLLPVADNKGKLLLIDLNQGDKNHAN